MKKLTALISVILLVFLAITSCEKKDAAAGTSTSPKTADTEIQKLLPPSTDEIEEFLNKNDLYDDINDRDLPKPSSLPTDA